MEYLDDGIVLDSAAATAAAAAGDDAVRNQQLAIGWRVMQGAELVADGSVDVAGW